MADIYLHDIRKEDLALFHQSLIRKYLFEQGIIPPKQRISELRNEMIRAYIKRYADEERETTAAFYIIPNVVDDWEEGDLKLLMERLKNKHIETWLIPGDKNLILVVPRTDVEEAEKTIGKLALMYGREY